MLHRVGIVLAIGALLATEARAQTAIKGASQGLAAPTRMINLGALTNNNEVGDLLRPGQGVRFSGAIFLDNKNCGNPFGPPGATCPDARDRPGFGLGAISNGDGASPFAPSISIVFDKPISGIAFNLFALDFVTGAGARLVTDSRFQLLDGSGNVIDADNDGNADFSFAAVPQDPLTNVGESLKWWGFSGGTFGGIRIVAPVFETVPTDVVYAMWLTNIEIAEPPPATQVVPEPSTVALVAAGMLGLVIARRRTRAT